MEDRPVSFPAWKTALMHAELSAHEREAFRREILAYLRHCKVRRAPATIAGARSYLADPEGTGCGPARRALRWFFREGAKPRDATTEGGSLKASRPPLAARIFAESFAV